MDEWRFDERGSRVARGSLQRAGPLPRDRVHDVSADDGALQVLKADQRGRQQSVDSGTQATAPGW